MLIKNIVIAKTPQVEDLTNLYKKYHEERQENKKDFIIGVNQEATKFYRITGYAQFQHPNGYNAISLQEIAAILKLNEEQTREVLTNCDAYFNGEDLDLGAFEIQEETSEPLPQKQEPQEEKEQEQNVNEEFISNLKEEVYNELFNRLDQVYAKALYQQQEEIKALKERQNNIIYALKSLIEQI